MQNIDCNVRLPVLAQVGVLCLSESENPVCSRREGPIPRDWQLAEARGARDSYVGHRPAARATESDGCGQRAFRVGPPAVRRPF